MATSVISNTILDASHNPVVGVTVVITLVPSPAFRISDSTGITETVTVTTNGSGVWTAALECTANITPLNSYYRVEERVPAAQGGGNTWAIQVGAADATLQASLVTSPPAATPLFQGVTSVDGLTGVVVLPTDGAAGVGTKRTIGTGAVQAAAGNHAHSGTYVPLSGAGLGGAGIDPQTLKDWTQGECYEPTAITRDANEVVTSATVKWPDGSAGTFTATTVSSTWFAVDAFTISHTASGKTVTQALVTRDSGGGVTVKPALTVA